LQPTLDGTAECSRYAQKEIGMNITNWTICLLIPLVLLGCDSSLNYSNRSGTLEDDYVAEPLSATSQKYKKALETSNNIINLFKNGEYQGAYNKYFSDHLKSQVSTDAFQNNLNKLRSSVGVLNNYKPMQWGFFSGKDQGMNLLYSVKIAEHEKNMMKYLFVFNHEGDFNEIVGFHVKVREGVTPPGTY